MLAIHCVALGRGKHLLACAHCVRKRRWLRNLQSAGQCLCLWRGAIDFMRVSRRFLAFASWNELRSGNIDRWAGQSHLLLRGVAAQNLTAEASFHAATAFLLTSTSCKQSTR
jgi:hypothetical protein